MKLKVSLAAGLFAALTALGSMTIADAHAPVVLPLHHVSTLALPLHHFAPGVFPVHPLPSTQIHSQLLTLLSGRGSSGAIRAQNSLNSALFSSGYKAGVANFPGGTLSGGVLNATGYYDEAPLNLTNYAYAGQGSLILNNSIGSSGSNFLTFTATPHVYNPTAPLEVGGHYLSPTFRAAITRNNTYALGGYSAGQSSYSGKIIGGQLSGGTSYDSPDGVHFTAEFNAIIAFGKDPLNVPGVFGTPFTFTPAPSYITFANGVTKTVASGSFLFTTNTVFNSIILGKYPYLAFGGNPYNVNTFNSFTGLPLSYLLFK